MPYTFTIPETEFYDDEKEEFVYTKEQTITIEHSLISISKWESKWHKPFMSDKPISEVEARDYIRCMTITQNVKPETYNYIPQNILEGIYAYMEDPMTGTTFREDPKGAGIKNIKGRKVSSEEIYYDMVALTIPFEPCEKWHINRLLTLIRICSEKNKPKKKMTAKERSALNKSRRKQHGTRG